MAFHPYPQDLNNPRIWRDAVPGSLDASRITFKNLEVLPAFLAQERFLFRGAPRRILLSEQGFNCVAGPEGQTLQAAAYAYAYARASRMETIDAFILHRHVDHRREGGLHLGLWSADPQASSPSQPQEKRRIYDLFRDADSPRFEEAAAFALPVLGIRSWSELGPRPVSSREGSR